MTNSFLIFLICICFFMLGCDSPRGAKIVSEVSDKNSKFDVKFNIQKFKKLNFEFQTQWLEGPYPFVEMNSTLIVFIYDQEGNLTDIPSDLILGFNAKMPDMGHGLEEAGHFTRIEEGVYVNKDITFQMDGDWNMEMYILDQNYNELDSVSWIEHI